MQMAGIHLAPYWNRGETPPRWLAGKLGEVPAVLLRSFAAASDDTRNRCVRLVNETLLAACDGPASGVVFSTSRVGVARGCCWLFWGLDESTRPLLRTLLRDVRR